MLVFARIHTSEVLNVVITVCLNIIHHPCVEMYN